MIIVFVNTFNSFNLCLASKTRENAFRNLGSMPIWYEIYIDLLEGRIYVPAELSTEYGVSKEYVETVKYISEVLMDVECYTTALGIDKLPCE